MRTKIALKAVAAAAFALGIQSANASSLIVNGSFEDNTQAAGTWAWYQNLVGWTGGPNQIELRNGVAGTAFDGVNFVELDTNANSSMFQTVATTLGQTYNLSFAYAPRINEPASTNGIEAFWDGNSLGIFTGDGTVSSAWHLFNFSVTGTGSDTLMFQAVGTSDSFGGSLDDVSLNATPLPAALPLFATGLGMLCLFGWLRKKRTGMCAA